MSINVTVTGNPVSIKRGKMITADPYTAKKEFEKRRLLRLEQVRQQSKELAQEVRNKVRKERMKQMGQIEQEGKEKLKNWKNRKLLELHNQYLDALDEIGMGHKEAEKLADESEMLENQRLKNEEVAKCRGKLAETKLQVQKNEENYKKAMPIQHKKLVRDVENTRAALVSSLKRKEPQTKKKKAKANINITVPNDSDFSEASSSDSSKHLPSIHEDDAESEGFCECSGSSEENLVDSDIEDSNNTKLGAKQNTPKEEGKVDPEAAKKPHSNPHDPKVKEKSYAEALDERRKLIEDFKNRPREVPKDTRVSDRIKRRQLMAAQPDYCDLIVDPTPVPEVAEITRIRDKISSRTNNLGPIDDVLTKDPLELSSEECVCTKSHASCPCKSKYLRASKSAGIQTDLVDGYSKNCKCKPKKGSKIDKDLHREQTGKRHAGEGSAHTRSENTGRKASNTLLGPPEIIPPKPFVKLKGSSDQPDSKPETGQSEEMVDLRSGASRVKHYDHPNRFTVDLPSTSQVEKVGAESIEVIPDLTSEKEWYEKMKQRDKEAQARGRKALEKEKIQRDYEEMMKKLPMLQRKEHIAQIGTDKPEYHMSEERLKERERERQNRLENVYSKVVPDLKPQIVTLPRRKHEMPRSDEPFEILDGDDSRTLRLGKWDTDTKPKTMFSAEEVQEIIKAFTIQKPEDRKTKLKQLLRSLKLQKEQLLNEIRALPRDDSIDALIGDLTSFSDPDDKHERSHSHRSKDKGKSGKKRQLAESDTSNTSTEISTQVKKSKPKTRSKDKYAKSPYKKMKKSDAKVLILQNTSTQTTPKATKEKSSTTTTTTTSSSVQVSEQQLQVEAEEGLPSGIRICTKTHVPCDCYKGKDGVSSEEVCKIYIKINEEESPKVEVVKNAGHSPEKDSGIPGLKESDIVDAKVTKSLSKHKEQPSKSPKKEKRAKSLAEEDKLSKDSLKGKKTKSVATETERPKKRVSKYTKKVEQPSKSSTQPAPGKILSPSRSRNESWKEHFSKNSMSTSSTSYMSPPDFSKQNTTASTEASRQSLYNLRKKPQQTNIDRNSLRSALEDPNVDRKLINYIKRLLSMSKTSVDDLGVSSSDVQTPSQSIIEMDSNNPLAALHNAIKLINFRAADIAKELSENEEIQAPPNSSATFSDSKVNVQKDDSTPEKDTNGNSANRAKASLLSEYAAVTDSCTKRIANLAAMIEQLRQEKIQMLDSPPLAQKTVTQKSRRDVDSSPPRSVDLALLTPSYSEKETSTKYLEFPPSEEKSKGTNSTASIDEEELNRRLLEIDMSLADKLKRFGQNKSENGHDDQLSPLPTLRDQQQHDPTSVSENQLNQTDQQMLQRLQRLMQESHEKEQQEPEGPLPQVNIEAPFVPFLTDIPKLPILAPEPEGLIPSREKRHPPPSKGLITAKKFNGDISLIPHELSTIVEAESQISTRISPNNSRTATSVAKDADPPSGSTRDGNSLPTDKSSAKSDKSDIRPHVEKEKSKNEPIKSGLKSPTTLVERISLSKDSSKNADESDTSKSLACTDGTCSSLMSSSSSKHCSSSSSSDMKSIEAMLKSIGMDWAIPTLHKTQEALALTSSSSSGDVSSKKKSARKSISSSEVSLREFLKKQMIRRISSSSLIKSDESPASFVKDCSEISAIQVNSSNEKAKQRTSTPVLSSKSTSKSKDEQQLFTGASEISSVRNSSCESSCNKSSGKQTFHSLAGEDDSSLTKYSIEK